MTPAWIGLGANLGDAATTVGAAITALDGLPGTRVLQASRLYATPAWGNEDQPPFVNAVAAVETSLAADELLQAMLALEQRFGRVRDAAVHWGRARWTWTCCCMARRCSTSPACRCRTPTCTSVPSCWCRWPKSRRIWPSPGMAACGMQ